MLDWVVIQNEYNDLAEKLNNQNLDQRTRATMQRKASHYASVLDLHNQIVEFQESIQACKLNAEKEQGEMRALYEDEIAENKPKLAALEKELEDLLYPTDERNERSVFLEIRAGTGGQEAALFALDLYKMYSAYALTRGWKVSIVECSQTDLGGFKELIAYIEGRYVYRFLKFESGVHRVQRVPKTESAGRIHTSTVTVAVFSEAEDVDVSINPGDLRVDVYRSSGAGGQHVNTTDSAVRLTHIPSGLVVTCQDERSQIKNKAKAMKVLQARLYEAERERREAEERVARKQQIGGGERAEKIRTYNFPQNRVTDHRTDVTLKKLDMVMLGHLDDLLNPLLEKEMVDRRAQGILFK